MRSDCLEGKTTANISTCPPKMKTTPKKDMMRSDATDCFPLQMVTAKSQPKEYVLNTTRVVISFISVLSALFYVILRVL